MWLIHADLILYIASAKRKYYQPLIYATSVILNKDLAMSLLLVDGAVFQIVDGIQIGAAGALRGYKDTKIPMIVNLFSYWVLSFSTLFLLGIVYRLPVSYIWLGFVLGLSSLAAILLTSRLSKISKIL